MRKFISICIILLVLFSLTGCNEEQKEALQVIIGQEVQDQNVYTPDSYQNYLTALERAKSVKENTFASKKEIANAQQDLQTAIDELYVKPDKTSLITKRDEAQNITLDIYIPNSTSELTDAIIGAESVIGDENARQENIDTAIGEIDNGIKALVKKPNKDKLSSLINKANNLNENKYTTASFSTINNTTSSCSLVLNNENSTQQDIDNAVEKMNNVLNGLVTAKNGVYKVYCSLSMTANMSVGNEWLSSIEYNGKSLRNGDTITAPLNSGITITGTVIESDSVPDYGSGSVRLSLDGGEKATKIYVRENRGRYSGNYAIWELCCSAELIERV